MIQLLASTKFGLLETPVIFFNDECMGGAQETWNRIRQWDQDPHRTPLELYEYTISAAKDTTDPRLREPSPLPEVSEACRSFQTAWLKAHLVVGPANNSFVKTKDPATDESSSASFSRLSLSPRLPPISKRERAPQTKTSDATNNFCHPNPHNESTQ